MKKPFIICPKCKSPRVQREMSLLLMVGAPQQWTCLNCGFKSHLFPEITPEKIKLSKNSKKHEKNS